MHNEQAQPSASSPKARPHIVVIWIDWYAYHVARFRGLNSVAKLTGHVVGLELVGGIGVHAGLKFREALPQDLRIETIEPDASWQQVNKLQLAWKLWKRLSSLKPRVVLVPGYYTLPGIAAAVWARTHNATSVLMTESCAFDHARSAAKESLKGLGLRMLFDWAVAGGKAHVDYLRQLGFPEQKLAGFYDVVDNDFFRLGTQAFRQDDLHRPVQTSFLYVGRLAPEKNVATLLESWLQYRTQGGTWSLVLVGDGPEAATLKARAHQSPFANDVFFPGLRASGELLPFYASAGCFVLPSTREPWGLVVNEAMASGLPIIVSNRCGCASDLVQPGVNGYLFQPHDNAALTHLLYEVEQLTPVQHRQMAEASYKIIASYTPHKFGLAISSIVAASRFRKATMQPAAGGSR